MKAMRIFLGMSALLVVAFVWGTSMTVAAPRASHRLAGTHSIPPHILPILDRACLDCHSAQTRWPWYNRLPLVSQAVQRDVKEGREHVDFSSWTPLHRVTANELQDICDAVSGGEMPPLSYRLVHPEARLSERDKTAVCEWAIQLQRPAE